MNVMLIGNNNTSPLFFPRLLNLIDANQRAGVSTAPAVPVDEKTQQLRLRSRSLVDLIAAHQRAERQKCNGQAAKGLSTVAAVTTVSVAGREISERSLLERKTALQMELREVQEEIDMAQQANEAIRITTSDASRVDTTWRTSFTRLLEKWQAHLWSGRSLEAVFASIDTNGNGLLDRDELKALFEKFNTPLDTGVNANCNCLSAAINACQQR
jgi:hypothetical protein